MVSGVVTIYHHWHNPAIQLPDQSLLLYLIYSPCWRHDILGLLISGSFCG
jgi:hypothetical protein